MTFFFETQCTIALSLHLHNVSVCLTADSLVFLVMLFCFIAATNLPVASSVKEVFSLADFNL